MLRKACLGPAVFSLVLLCSPTISAAGEVEDAKQNHIDGFEASTALLDNSELGTMRGGQGVTIANQTLTSITSGNSIGGDVAGGAVNLGNNALSGFNGLGNIVINTGSQVSLQSGMNITVNVNP